MRSTTSLGSFTELLMMLESPRRKKNLYPILPCWFQLLPRDLSTLRNENWVMLIATRLGFESTMKSRGRPKRT